MTPGCAVAALAASAVFAPTAAAQKVDRGFNELRGGQAVAVERRGPNGRVLVTDQQIHAAHHGVSTRQLRRQAARTCRRAIRNEAYHIGFRDVDFNGRYVERIGPRGFAVTFATEFEGRRREFHRNVTCVVRRGEVRRIEGVPRGRGRGYRDFHRSYRGADYGAYGGYKSGGITVTFGKTW
ncbi:MAG: hypothetical protein AAFX03_01740 [Pseudomonadota bacterium]